MAQTEALFRDDAYLRDGAARVVGINDRGGILLDRTMFYATSGGQPGDTGRLTREDGSTIEIAATVTGETKDEIITFRQPSRFCLNWARRFSWRSTGSAVSSLCACTRPAIF